MTINDLKKMDQMKKETLKNFEKDLDKFEGFVIVAFKKNTKNPDCYWACRNYDLAVASVTLSHLYADEVGL